MPQTTTTTTAPVTTQEPAPPAAAPITAAQVHHSWLSILMQILSISAAIAPAAAAPFVNAKTENLIATESAIAEGITAGLSGATQTS